MSVIGATISVLNFRKLIWDNAALIQEVLLLKMFVFQKKIFSWVKEQASKLPFGLSTKHGHL